MFTHKSVTLAPSQEANKKKKPKSKQAAELCASGKCWEWAGPSRGLGKQRGTCWGFCSRAEHSAGENRISWGMEPILPRSLVLQHPQSTGKRQQPCQQWDGSGAELLPGGYRDSSPADPVTGTPGMGQACLPEMCSQFQVTGASEIKTTIM